MRLSWRERLLQQPQLWAFARWPHIDPANLPSARHRDFMRNRQIVAQVLAGECLGHIAQRYQISVGRISQLLNRCLGGDEDRPPALTWGLVPYAGVVVRQRQQPLPTLGGQISGTGCAFQALLAAVPGLREGLDTMIEAKLKDSAKAQRLSPSAFHGTFKNLLAEAHWPTDCYPYTTDSLAYESVRRYLARRIAEMQQARAERRQPPPRDLGVANPRFRALRAIQIDEQVLDIKTSIHLILNEELIPLQVARANVLVATDVDTQCVLGYHLVPSGHPNQQDLLTLLDNCLQPWRPLSLSTPGLEYAPGAAFPSGLEVAHPLSFGLVQLDNAWMHRAQSILHLLGEQYGATLSYGLPGMPKVRQRVESVFDYINQHCTHRAAATTGSYPTDPQKESRKNQKQPPKMTFHTLNEALSVILTEHNITRLPALGNVSPLTLFAHHCANHYVRYVPEVVRTSIQPLLGTQEVNVHWNQQEGRLPHINFYYARYQGPGLLRLIGREKKIRVQFDRRDIRTLRAFTLSGEDLGSLQVSRPWQRFAHTLATRQWIHKNARKYRFSARDPLAGYFMYLLAHRDQPDAALSLLRVYSEYTSGAVSSLNLEHPPEPTITSPPNADRPTRHTWNTGLANRRE